MRKTPNPSKGEGCGYSLVVPNATESVIGVLRLSGIEILKRSGKMIYFDNAATTYPKPPEVIKTMSRATVRYGANPGRGGHKMSYLTSEAVYETRKGLPNFSARMLPKT